MSSTTLPGHVSGLLNRERTIAGIGFSRWMVPPAALCVHLCIGQAYAFSVFNLPLTKLIGITQSAPDDWKLTDLGWIFSIAIVFLGLSAAVLGRWLEEVGPRRAMFTAACASAAAFWSPRSACTCTRSGSLSRLRRDRRHRARARLHLAGVDADPLVSGPPRHGDRHGDHGLRRRRHDRLAAVGLLMQQFSTRRPIRRRRDLRRARHHLLLLHDVRAPRSCACRRRAGSRQAMSPPVEPSKLITTQ